MSTSGQKAKPVGKAAKAEKKVHASKSGKVTALAFELSRIAEQMADVATRIEAEISSSDTVTGQFSDLTRQLAEQREASLRAEVQLSDLRLQLSGEQDRRRRIENELLLLRTALETMQLGVTIANRNGIIVYVNPADAAMHGHTRDELLGKDVGVYAVGFQHKPLSPERLRGLKSYQRETYNRRKDGSIFKVRLLSDVVKDTDGEPVGLVTMCEELPSDEAADKAEPKRAKKKRVARKSKKK